MNGRKKIADRTLVGRYTRTVLFRIRRQSIVKQFMITYRETTERSGPD